jgi:hypothetical protein
MADRVTALTLRADRSRHHLSDLMDSLQSQITPSELLGQFVGRSASAGSGPNLAQALALQVSKNPIACALIAAGIGWLVISDRLEKSRPAKRKRERGARRLRPTVRRRRVTNEAA